MVQDVKYTTPKDTKPYVVAENNSTHYHIIKRSRYYAVKKKDAPLKSITKWFGDELLQALLFKGNYTRLKTPVEYTE